MAAKQIHFRSEAREKVLRGASALADAVRVTLGPKARCVLIERKWGKPLVSDDGVSIAKEVELQDAEENLGVQMLRQAAERTGDRVGDGTTTSTLLAYEMFAEGVKNVAAGASAIDLRRGLQRGLKIVLEAVRAQAKPVETLLAKTHVATIAAHNEPEVGAMVAEAVTKVGTEGAVTVEEACHAGDTVESAERLMGENRIRRIPGTRPGQPSDRPGLHERRRSTGRAREEERRRSRIGGDDGGRLPASSRAARAPDDEQHRGRVTGQRQ